MKLLVWAAPAPKATGDGPAMFESGVGDFSLLCFESNHFSTLQVPGSYPDSEIRT